jgi:HTH-type transcriptional regulator/antitoxin HipB
MPTPPHTLVTAVQLSSVLQAARKAQGLTQSALAGRIGLSQSRISYLELNARELSVEQLMTWCAALGLELTIGIRDSHVASSVLQADW